MGRGIKRDSLWAMWRREGEEVATLLAMEGYERWEDNMLVKFNEFNES